MASGILTKSRSAKTPSELTEIDESLLKIRAEVTSQQKSFQTKIHDEMTISIRGEDTGEILKTLIIPLLLTDLESKSGQTEFKFMLRNVVDLSQVSGGVDGVSSDQDCLGLALRQMERVHLSGHVNDLYQTYLDQPANLNLPQAIAELFDKSSHGCHGSIIQRKVMASLLWAR